MSDVDPMSHENTDVKPGNAKPDSSGYGAGGDAKSDIEETSTPVAPAEHLARED